ncbi:unnamed protein product [Effrenium voratum]|nr:unnamed protein product [Effrenium voratum]
MSKFLAFRSKALIQICSNYLQGGSRCPQSVPTEAPQRGWLTSTASAEDNAMGQSLQGFPSVFWWQIVPRQLNFCRVNYSSCFTGCRCDLRPPNVLKAALERRTGPVPLRTVPTTADGCHCSCHKAAYGEISFVQCWSCWRCWTGREAHGARRQHVQ